ncbi:MAG: ATP-dependent 6-phosphofructokinase [Alphaproteobacteria bacterium]|nr:ATP-dependent 6-phosphofructokinase [Alphaproteobacteria bacterium]MCD8570815.1 ATP-dependent 6-phosphofructokinase [Alphaproteobacteria bacterium]
MSKHIGILTSGGDCAGLNAVLRAAVIRAHALGFKITGLENGTAGLLESPPHVRELTPADITPGLLRQGGTILGTTNNRNPFSYPMPDGSVKDRSDELIAALNGLGIDILIGIGGDGSFDILSRLADQGKINFIGIPKTIDNDVAETEFSVGFDTAVSVAAEALDRLQPTAASHDRVMILEVMGRDAGHIALNAGIAGGADVILIPEIPYTINAIAQKIKAVKEAGRNFALVIVSEALQTLEGENREVVYYGGEKRYGGVGEYLGPRIAEATGFETRVTVLGHVQRGGQPTWNDRLIAQAFGVHAVDLAKAGKFGRMVGWAGRKVIDVPLSAVIAKPHVVDPASALVHTARALGISFGD